MRRNRRGISLLEVLISMFVLAVGLLSVAALIPAGRYEIGQGSRLENASMIGRAAFRDITIRNFLYPGDADGTDSWQTVGGVEVWDPDGSSGGSPTQPFVVNGVASARVAVAIDPLGMLAITEGGGTSTTFPYNVPLTDPHLTRIRPIIPSVANPPREFWDIVFRSSVDLTIEENRGEPFDDISGDGLYDSGVDTWDSNKHDANGNGQYDGPNSDLPPHQYWFRDPGNSDLLTNAMRRASEGNYSWLATIVSDPTKSALDSKVTVSVAVFHKRNLSAPGAGELAVGVSLAGVGGGTVTLTGLGPGSEGVKPGQWIMLAGRQIGPPALDYFAWYRVVSAARVQGTNQVINLAGRDWSPLINNSLQAFLFDNIVAVYEKNLSLEIE